MAPTAQRRHNMLARTGLSVAVVLLSQSNAAVATPLRGGLAFAHSAHPTASVTQEVWVTSLVRRQNASSTSQTATSTSASSSSSSQSTTSSSSSSSTTSSSSSSSTSPTSTSSSSSSSATTSTSNSSSSATSLATSSSSSVPSSTASVTSSSAFLSHGDKNYPAHVVIIIASLLGALFVFVVLGKCYAVMQRRRQQGDDDDEKEGKYTKKDGASPSRKKTLGKSIRRAFTKRKVGVANSGSFARRNRDGCVLVDVGDEVFAVTTEVAAEYERQRKRILADWIARFGVGPDGRVSFPPNQPNPLRQALYSAQLVVAEEVAGKMEAGEPSDVSYHTSREGSDSADGEGLVCKISKGLAQSVRSFYLGDHASEKEGAGNESVYSFDAEKQIQAWSMIRQAQVPPAPTVPIMTQGAEGWTIERLDGDAMLPEHHCTADSKRGSFSSVAASRSTDSDGRTSRGGSALSHTRTSVNADVRTRANDSRRRQQDETAGQRDTFSVDLEQGEYHERARTVNIKRSRERLTNHGRKRHGKGEQPTGQYRHRSLVEASSESSMLRRQTMSTAQGSPRMLQQRSSQEDLKQTAASQNSSATMIHLNPTTPDRSVVRAGARAATIAHRGGVPQNASPARANNDAAASRQRRAKSVRDVHADSTPSTPQSNSSAPSDVRARDLYRPLPSLPPNTSRLNLEF